MQSPKLKYPLSGEGILIIIVATQQSAASIEANAIFCVFVFISFSPIDFYLIIVYNKSDNMKIIKKGEKYITR